MKSRCRTGASGFMTGRKSPWRALAQRDAMETAGRTSVTSNVAISTRVAQSMVRTSTSASAGSALSRSTSRSPAHASARISRASASGTRTVARVVFSPPWSHQFSSEFQDLVVEVCEGDRRRAGIFGGSVRLGPARGRIPLRADCLHTALFSPSCAACAWLTFRPDPACPAAVCSPSSLPCVRPPSPRARRRRTPTSPVRPLHAALARTLTAGAAPSVCPGAVQQRAHSWARLRSHLRRLVRLRLCACDCIHVRARAPARDVVVRGLLLRVLELVSAAAGHGQYTARVPRRERDRARGCSGGAVRARPLLLCGAFASRWRYARGCRPLNVQQ
jgi:hypothetical protein